MQSAINSKFDNARHEETQTTENDEQINMKEQGPTFAHAVESTQSEIENMVQERLSTLNDHVDGLEGQLQSIEQNVKDRSNKQIEKLQIRLNNWVDTVERQVNSVEKRLMKKIQSLEDIKNIMNT